MTQLKFTLEDVQHLEELLPTMEADQKRRTLALIKEWYAQKAQEMGLKQKSGLEIEVVEEKKNAADNSPKFEQTIEVVREGISQESKRGRRKKS